MLITTDTASGGVSFMPASTESNSSVQGRPKIKLGVNCYSAIAGNNSKGGF